MNTYVLAWAMGSVGMGSLQRKTTLSLLTLTSSSTAFIPAVRPAVVAAAVFSHAVWNNKMFISWVFHIDNWPYCLRHWRRWCRMCWDWSPQWDTGGSEPSLRPGVTRLWGATCWQLGCLDASMSISGQNSGALEDRRLHPDTRPLLPPQQHSALTTFIPDDRQQMQKMKRQQLKGIYMYVLEPKDRTVGNKNRHGGNY